jgi:hypothetical protein
MAIQKLKTIQFKGKPYVEVKERLRHFRENYEGFSLESEIIKITDSIVVIKATIKDASGRIIASAHAMEEKGNGYINETSWVENCDTSAWGRVLGNLGIGIDGAVATYDELTFAIKQEENLKAFKNRKVLVIDPTPPPPQTSTPTPTNIITPESPERWLKAVNYAKEKGVDALLEIFQLSEENTKHLISDVYANENQ